MAFDPGDVWNPELTVRDAAGVPTAATVTLAVTSPSGTVTAPVTSTTSAGVYTATVPLTEAGAWRAVWTVSGALTGVETQYAYVRVLGSNVISVAEVKARLNKTSIVDDGEIEEMIDAALAEYAIHVGPLPGPRTETFDGGQSAVVLASADVTTITAAQYADGTAIAPTDLTVSNGIVYWGYGTAGRFTYGSRNVSITYTVGAMPANHREVIIADVAGYFEATQRGNTASALPTGYADALAPQPGRPVVLFPRIAELAKQYPSVA